MSAARLDPERLAAFGHWLARERELRGVARHDVAKVTKLAPAAVEALESGEQDRIPPRAYAVGCLRAYAAAVGLDADEVVLRFQEVACGSPTPWERSRRVEARWARRAGMVGAAALVGLVVLLAAILVW